VSEREAAGTVAPDEGTLLALGGEAAAGVAPSVLLPEDRPWVEGQPARVPAPTRRLAALLASTAPLWLLSGSDIGFAVALAATAAVALAVCIDLFLLPRELLLQRLAPATAGVGDRAEGAYRVRSHWPRAVRTTLHDRLPPAVERAPDAFAPLVLRPGEETTVPFTIAGRDRGLHALGPAALHVEGPLGLVVRTLRYELGDSVTVTPSIAAVRRYRLLALQHRLRDAGIRNIRRRGEGTTFARLREYVVGDDPRHVDWKATARRNTPIVREFTIEQGQTVMICVDAGRLMTQLSAGLPRFEHALSAALVLADVAAHSGDQVGLMVFDDQLRALVPPARGTGSLAAVRDALVPARATMAEPDYAMAFRTLATRHRKRSLVVLFTDVVDPRASQALIAHTTRSAARHLLIVVALRNDALADAAEPAGHTTSLGMFESAAAEELLSAREEALQRMRQAGVVVLDVSLRQLSAAVVNRYLEVKARSAV
jgi:uncharacterized protein (DUF58 family)